MSYINQKYIVTVKVNEWLNLGYTPSQVALLYNHPASRGKKCSSGYNKKVGIYWNSCNYVKKIIGFLSKKH